MSRERCSCGRPSVAYVSYVTDESIEDPSTGAPVEWENPFCAECLTELIRWQNENKLGDAELGWTMTLYSPREAWDAPTNR